MEFFVLESYRMGATMSRPGEDGTILRVGWFLLFPLLSREIRDTYFCLVFKLVG
jgi:hypothetical protein